MCSMLARGLIASHMELQGSKQMRSYAVQVWGVDAGVQVLFAARWWRGLGSHARWRSPVRWRARLQELLQGVALAQTRIPLLLLGASTVRSSASLNEHSARRQSLQPSLKQPTGFGPLLHVTGRKTRLCHAGRRGARGVLQTHDAGLQDRPAGRPRVGRPRGGCRAHYRQCFPLAPGTASVCLQLSRKLSAAPTLPLLYKLETIAGIALTSFTPPLVSSPLCQTFNSIVARCAGSWMAPGY